MRARPRNCAARYCEQGVDEIVVLDVSATLENRQRPAAVDARDRARPSNVPVTIGGGVELARRHRSAAGGGRRQGGDQLGRRVRADPSLTRRAAAVFGRQCVVASIDALRDGDGLDGATRSATRGTQLDAVAWARDAASLGAGELLLTSIDADGTRARLRLGVDARGERQRSTSRSIASGGARERGLVCRRAHRRAARTRRLGASVFHFGVLSRRRREGALPRARHPGARVIVPSIDLLDGKVVQLQQGARKVLEREDAVALAERFARVGTVAVVDLDAALGRGDNRELVRALCRAAPCRVGGGLRDADAALDALRAGAEEVVIGTAATPKVLGRVAARADVRGAGCARRAVATEGWTRPSAETPLERARRLERYCGGFLYTYVEREGMLGGPDLRTATALRGATDGALVLAGGITTIEDDRLAGSRGHRRAGRHGALHGRARRGRRVRRGGRLRAHGRARADDRLRCGRRAAADAGLFHAGVAARALREGAGVYWSRSRQALWRKGETSGNAQRLVRAERRLRSRCADVHGRADGPDLPHGRGSLLRRRAVRLAGADRAHRRASASAGPRRTRCKLAGDPVLLDGEDHRGGAGGRSKRRPTRNSPGSAPICCTS